MYEANGVYDAYNVCVNIVYVVHGVYAMCCDMMMMMNMMKKCPVYII